MNVVGEFFYHFVDLVNVEIRLFGHFVTGVSGVLAWFFSLAFGVLGIFYHHVVCFFPFVLEFSLELIDLVGQVLELHLIDGPELFLMEFAVLLDGWS